MKLHTDAFQETKFQISGLERLSKAKQILSDLIGNSLLTRAEDNQIADICAELEQLEKEKTEIVTYNLKFFFTVAV